MCFSAGFALEDGHAALDGERADAALSIPAEVDPQLGPLYVRTTGEPGRVGRRSQPQRISTGCQLTRR
jgi:hypothetical protein